MDAHQVLVFLLEIGVLLGVAVALGRLSQRLRMPAVVGELAAGVLLGPSLFAHVAPGPSDWLLPHDTAQFHLLDAVGQLGVLLLVGVTGMYIDVGLIRRKGAAVASIGTGALLVPLGLGLAAGFLLPRSLAAAGAPRPVFALFIGVALGVSAIPVIAKTLLEMRLLHRDVGQLIMCSAAADDIAGWLLLGVVSALAATTLHTGQVATALAGLVAIAVFTAVAGRPAVRMVFRLTARSGDPAVTVPVVVVLLVLAAAGTQALGLEGIVGTFLCGIVIGSCGLPLERSLSGLRTVVMAVLAPIFFATAGLRMDLTALRRPAVLAAAGTMLILAVAGKFAGAYVGARVARLDRWSALALGAGLNSRGVVEVVVAMVGLRLGVLRPEVYTIIVLIAIATSLMAPPMLRVAVRRIPVTREEDRRATTYPIELSTVGSGRTTED
jgi:Kef-type K+ transport system membrane component KefB